MKTLFKRFNLHGAFWQNNALPITVWVCAVCVVCLLFNQQMPRIEMTGIASSENRLISSQVNGRLKLIHVKLFEDVKAGDILAILENDNIQAQLATATAENTRLNAELLAMEDRLRSSNQNKAMQEFTDSRRFNVDVERNRLRILDLTTLIESDQIILNGYKYKLDLLTELHKDNIATSYEYQLAQNEYQALARKLEENQNALIQTKLDLENSITRRDQYAKMHPIPQSIQLAIEPLRSKILIQQRKIYELKIEDAMMIIQSPIDGRVSQLVRGSGETVLRGEPILSVSATQTSQIVAYAKEIHSEKIEEGLTLSLFKRSAPQTMTPTTIQIVGPEIVQLPKRLWPNPSLPSWGIPVILSVPEDLMIKPGETVGVIGL